MVITSTLRGADMRCVRFKKKGQVTIPKEFVDSLHLEEGDQLECRLEDGRIVIVPTISVSKDQAWFWSNKWQEEEMEAQMQINKDLMSEDMDLDRTLNKLDDLSRSEN